MNISRNELKIGIIIFLKPTSNHKQLKSMKLRKYWKRYDSKTEYTQYLVNKLDKARRENY